MREKLQQSPTVKREQVEPQDNPNDEIKKCQEFIQELSQLVNPLRNKLQEIMQSSPTNMPE